MHVKITGGLHRGNTVNGIFKLVQAYKPKKGTDDTGTVKVSVDAGVIGNTVLTPAVTVKKDQFVYCDKDGNEKDLTEMSHKVATGAQAQAMSDDIRSELESLESDDDAKARIAETFQMLEELADGCQEGIINGLVISGPAGAGKSHGVEEALERASMMSRIAVDKPMYEVVTGTATPIALYKKLYDNRHKGFVTVLDDCDSVLFDETSLNILKAVLDTKPKRRVSWLAESRALKEEDIPNSFDFEGSIIFISNIDFERTTSSKIKDHLAAIMSRCHYIDVELNSTRDLLLRIEQVCDKGMLDSRGLSKEQQAEILDYIRENSNYLRELSLRMVIKLADLYQAKKERWKTVAEHSCLRSDVRYKRALEAAKAKAKEQA